MLKALMARTGVIAIACSLWLSAAAMADDLNAFDVPAGELAAALKSLAAQADVELVYRPEQMKDIRTEGLKGSYSPQEAVTLLLKGTTLQVHVDSSGAMVISPVPSADAGESASPIAEAVAGAEVLLLMAQSEVDSPESAASPGSTATTRFIGKVSEGESGSPVAGAIVRILETGEATSTDELGAFRFKSLPGGDYTLAISYIGFAEKLWRVNADGTAARHDFVLEKSSLNLEEVTVFGTRSARAKALNLQRTADNTSSVISADLLGDFPDSTISEALRRAPGVSFERGLLGEGNNISIRGLAPDMNNIQLNGLNLPNSGFGRAPNIGNFLADSVEKITINESLLPSHDSAGTGGLVQIETKSPLARPHRYANFSVETGRKGMDFGDDLSGSATLSGTFGQDRQFGLSLSSQYAKRQGKSYTYGASVSYGQYLPLSPFGTPILPTADYFDPRLEFPYEEGVDLVYPNTVSTSLSDVEATTIATTVSAEWQVSAASRLQLDVTRADQTQDQYRRSLQIGFPHTYALAPVDSLDGEIRQALRWDGTMFGYQSHGLTRGEKNLTDTVSLRGSTSVGRWDHQAALGYAKGSYVSPAFDASFYTPQGTAFDPAFVDREAVDVAGGDVVSVYDSRDGRGIPLPRLQPAGWAAVNDSAAYLWAFGQSARTSGSNDRYSASLASRWSIDRSHFKYLEVGTNLESARFVFRTDAATAYYSALSAADFGLRFDSPDLAVLGMEQQGFNSISRPDYENFVRSVAAISSGPAPLLFPTDATNPLAKETGLREKSLAAYLESRVDFGKLSVIGGVRINRGDIESDDINSPQVIRSDGIQDVEFTQRFTRIVTNTAVVTDVMPRFQANYRQTDNLVFRGSYYLSIARPPTYLLGSERQINLNLAGRDESGQEQPILSIFEGNPGLEPAFTHNYALGAELYTGQIGLIKLDLFYKRIENLLTSSSYGGFSVLDGVELPDDPYFNDLPENTLVFGTRPVNSDDVAEHWGFTLAAERQFTFLPGFWSGFGVYANYFRSFDLTPQDNYIWFSSPVYDESGNLSGTEMLPLELDRAEARASSGTLSLTYSSSRVDGSLAYSWQKETRGSFFQHGLTEDWNSFGGLDMRLQYRMKLGQGDYRLYFEGNDLLKDAASPDNLQRVGSGSSPTYILGSTYFGGRALRIGVAASF